MSRLEEVLNSARIETRTSGVNVGREFINICCPFCGEVRFHCGINEIDLWFKCWVCGESGQWWKIRERLEREYPRVDWGSVKSDKEAVYLDDAGKRDFYGGNLWREFDEVRDEKVIDWLEAMPFKDEFDDDFRVRGFDFGVLKMLGIKMGVGILRGYVVFADENGIVARKYSGSVAGPKWWKKSGSERYIFGERWARMRNPGVGVLTEGVFDCLRCPAGTSLAFLGVAYSDDILGRIVDIFRETGKMVIGFDRGVKEANLERLYLELEGAGYEVSLLDWNGVDGRIKDIDEMYLAEGREAVMEFLGLEEEKGRKLI